MPTIRVDRQTFAMLCLSQAFISYAQGTTRMEIDQWLQGPSSGIYNHVSTLRDVYHPWGDFDWRSVTPPVMCRTRPGDCLSPSTSLHMWSTP